MNDENKELKMSFDLKTIDHLGIKMYSQLPNAIAELIANSYDACATNVSIHLNDRDDEKTIVVEDDGIGMDFNEINDKFLRIGRNRRETEDNKTPCGRIPTGRKGLGKLAFFGIGNKINITTKKNGTKTDFVMNWDDLINTDDGSDYKPNFEIEEINRSEHGTKIILSQLKRKSNFDFSKLSISIAKLFNFQDADFIVSLIHNSENEILIDNKLKYEEIEPQFEWKFPSYSEAIESDYPYKSEIRGSIITTEKPLRPGFLGITLFSNGRMVNKQEFFGSMESSHFFSYTTGWLDVDFVDNWKEDMISTNRQSLEGESPEIRDLRDFLQLTISQIHTEWREKRKNKKRERLNEKTSINLDNWFEKLPDKVSSKIESIVSKVIDESELPESVSSEVIESIHDLVPEYPFYHWRHLHSAVREVSENDYKNEDYYRAFQETMKHYINKIREKVKDTSTADHALLTSNFGDGKPLSVTRKFKKPDGSNFTEDTLKNIEEGQKYLSMGVNTGARNPVNHEEIKDLKDSGLFTEKDCLDALSLLSHLMKRLEDT